MSSRTYVGTKAFALRGSLLDSPTLKKLAEAASLEELVNRLRATPYTDLLANLSTPYSARKIELALRERLAYVHHSITEGSGRYRILQLYYLKNIAWDLKLALKAKALNRTFEESVEYLDMKAEELVGRRDLIVKVLSAGSINEAVNLLSGSEFSQDAENALSAFSARGEVRYFDIYVDRAVLSSISREYSVNGRVYSKRGADVAGVSDIVSLDIDAYNVVTVLRAKLWRLQEQEIQSLVVSPVRKVSSQTLTRIIGTDSVSEAAKLAESSYPLRVQPQSDDEKLIDSVEDEFTRLMLQTASKAFVWQGLGPGATLALIKLLEFEVGNLAAIAIGVEAGIQPANIISKLRLT